MDNAEIERQLRAVVHKLEAGISHEQIIIAGAADWQYSERTMRCFIVFATARIVQAARQHRQKNAVFTSIASAENIEVS